MVPNIHYQSPYLLIISIGPNDTFHISTVRWGWLSVYNSKVFNMDFRSGTQINWVACRNVWWPTTDKTGAKTNNYCLQKTVKMLISVSRGLRWRLQMSNQLSKTQRRYKTKKSYKFWNVFWILNYLDGLFCFINQQLHWPVFSIKIKHPSMLDNISYKTQRKSDLNRTSSGSETNSTNTVSSYFL